MYYACEMVVAEREPERVLIVDDDAAARDELARALAGRGWLVEMVGELASAITVAIANQPTIIVTELLLPDVTSLQFARSLRSAVDNDVLLVAVSRAGADILEHARAAGFDLVFGKPLDLDELDRGMRRTTRMPKLA